MTISGSGPVVDLSNGTLAVTLNTASSNGSSTEGMRLDNLAGTFTANAGSLQTATNADVSISGNNASDTLDFTYAGTITDDLGTLVSVANQNGGTKLFSGAITDGNDGDGSGISLTNNTGATINFTGGLTLSTGANPAFTATGGGTINVTTANNTIVTTTGKAVNASGVTFGASGVTFKSISANGGSNGITLLTTSGNFTVTGDGTGHANGSGGTIQGITGGVIGNAPVFLQTVSGVITLKSMDMLITINAYSGMHVDNNAGGTITVNVTGCTFKGVQAGNSTQQKALLQFEGGNTGANASNTTANVQDSFFFDNRTYGVVASAAGDSIMNFTLNQSGFGTEVNTGNPVNNPGTTITTPPPFHALVSIGSNAKVDYSITNNTFWGADGLKGAVYAVTISGASTVATAHNNGSFIGNKIGKAGTVGSGCKNGCAGLGILPGTQGTYNALITDNDVRQINSDGGIALVNTAGGGATFNSSVVIRNNTLAEPDTTGAPLFLRGIIVSPGNSGGAATTVCADIGGASAGQPNIISGAWSSTMIRVTNLNNTVLLKLPGYAGAATDTAAVNAFVSGRNGGATVGSTAGTTGFTGGAACVAPLLLADGGVGTSDLSNIRSSSPLVNDDLRREASAISALSGAVSTSVSQSQLDPIVAAAAERWVATGLTPQQMSTLRGLKFVVADLKGGYLGESDSTNVLIDRNAGGKGWYIGADSSSDLLFSRSVSTTRRYTDPRSAPAGHLDLLTTIEHEMGHKLGLPDSYANRDRNNLMYGYLTVGERRLPAAGQARSANSGTQATQHLKLSSAANASKRTAKAARRSDNPITPLAGETVNVNIGTIPAGKSVTITFQVTLNNAMPAGTSQVSTQGSITWDGPELLANPDGANTGLVPNTVVLTDDPATPALGDATVTPIDSPTAAGSTVSGQIVDSNGNPVEGAGIRMSGAQNRLTVTDANGFYHFDNVEANGFYTVSATRANFSFSPSERSFSVLGQTTDAAFSASPTGSALNPLDTTEYFVRQQYVDFLNREPDEAGLNFWYNNIEGCGNDAKCRMGKRTDTSAAFFLSTEFQQTGYLVYKTYQAAFGDLPGTPVPVRLGEFKPDTQQIGNGVIVNATGWDTKLNANKLAFMAEFVQRSRFTGAYATSLTPAEFVNQLFTNAGVTPSDTDRAAAINEFGAAGTSADVAARGRALQRVAENSMLTQQEFNQAFVLIQYFGYLRRDPNAGPDPDFTGYNFWLQKLNTFNGNFGDAEMVKSFLVSGEYRGRFPR
jgi:hypothetical protein